MDCEQHGLKLFDMRITSVLAEAAEMKFAGLSALCCLPPVLQCRSGRVGVQSKLGFVDTQ